MSRRSLDHVRRHDERGSSLIIALAFLALFSLWLSATLATTESGMHVAQSMRVQPKRLYAADAAIEQAIQKIRYDPTEGRWDDADCDWPARDQGAGVVLQDPPQEVFVMCEPDGNSGRGDEGESSPPVGLIGLSNGALNEFAYQQYGNSVVRIDGGASSTTPLLFQNGTECGQQQNCQQLNLCPRNEKTISDGVLVRNTAAVTSLSAPWVQEDIGVPIVGNGIPAGTTIASYSARGLIGMSRNATASGINRTIRFRENYPRLQNHCRPPTDPDEQRKGRLTSAPRALGGESCDQGRVVALQFNCDAAYPVAGGVAEPDPGYAPDKTSGFPRQDVPLCDSAARVVELQPGRYDSAAALTTLTTGCDKIIWFKPGSYYFDFPDNDAVWTIGASNLPNLTVVGGQKTWDREPFSACVTYNNQTNVSTVTAASNVFKAGDANSAYLNAGYNLPYKALIKTVTSGGTKATFTGPPLTNNFGCSGSTTTNTLYTVSPGLSNLGSLCNPTTNSDHPGVQFIFGGQSRVVLIGNKTELCSPVAGTRQQVAVYGVSPGAARGQLRAQSGCLIAQPYTPSGGSACAMVYAPQGSQPALMIHGTLYAPSAAVDLSLQGVGYQVVSRGIIARVIALAISPSAQFTDPVIYSPNFGSIPGAPRKMVLTACIGNPCPALGGSGTPKIRALVRFKDDDDRNNPGVPGYKVFVDSWSVL